MCPGYDTSRSDGCGNGDTAVLQEVYGVGTMTPSLLDPTPPTGALVLGEAFGGPSVRVPLFSAGVARDKHELVPAMSLLLQW
jgi:hypothetical protein